MMQFPDELLSDVLQLSRNQPMSSASTRSSFMSGIGLADFFQLIDNAQYLPYVCLTKTISNYRANT